LIGHMTKIFQSLMHLTIVLTSSSRPRKMGVVCLFIVIVDRLDV